MDRLTPSWIRRSRSPRDIPAKDVDSRPSTSSTLLSPRPTDSTNSSTESRRLSESSKNGRRRSIRGAVNRLRSSSSASSLGGKAQERDVNDIHDWFNGFQRYNQLVTRRTFTDQPNELTKASKALSKNCGGGFVHGLPEAAFDFSLLWCPAIKITRETLDEPSWSWKAYSGAVNYPFDPTTCPDVYRAPKEDGEVFRSEIQNYHIGPSSAQYTGRREKNESLRTKYPPYFHAPRGSDSSSESNTLRFTTTTIPAEGFTAEQLHYDSKEIPCSQLVNDKAQQCGVIMDFESTISEPSSTGPYEFVLLSRSLRREPESSRKPANSIMHPPGTPIWDGERFVWNEEIVEHDEEAFEAGPWKMLNVMLIRWVGEYAERVAIAKIHEDAWNARSPARKEIVLQ